LWFDYPAENVAFFGLFIDGKSMQGKGAGSRIAIRVCNIF